MPNIFQNHDGRMIFYSHNFFLTVRGSAKEGGKERKKGEVRYSHKRFFILAHFSTKNTGGSVSLLVLNSIIDVEESVSFLRYR